MKTNNRLTAVLLASFFFLGAAQTVWGINLGLIAGTINKPSQSFWGVSGQMGMIVPVLKLDFEWVRYSGDPDTNALTAGIMARPKLGKISPYGVVGVGTEFDVLSFHFSRYNSFSFWGGGVHLFLMDIMSLRVDGRFQHFTDRSRFRFSAGLFVHL
jgi:hypothetical protein